MTAKLFVMVGLPGSGKSCMALELKNLYPNSIIVSSDAIRKETFGSEKCQRNPSLIFEQMRQTTIEAIRQGRTVIYDATNISRKRRMELLKDLKNKTRLEDGSIGFEAVCIFMATPYLDCLKRNAARERQVPDSVIDRMYRTIELPFSFEGWWDVVYVYPSTFEYVDEDKLLQGTTPHDNPHHSFSIERHCFEAEIEAIKSMSKRAIKYAAKIHDLGKLKTKTFVNGKGEVTETAHYYGHHCVSAYDALFYQGMKKFGKVEADYILQLVQYHMQPYFFRDSKKSEEKWRKMFGDSFFESLMELHEIDKAAH